MSIGVISKRYAKALYAFSAEQGGADAIYRNMLQLIYTLEKVKELPFILRDPAITPQQRVELICNAAEASPLFKEFAHLVVKEEREELLLFIAYSFVSLYQKKNNIIPVKLTTALPASETLKAFVTKFVAGNSGATVHIENTVNDSIIGGFVIETESKRLDASISSQLRGMRKKLVEQNRKLV